MKKLLILTFILIVMITLTNPVFSNEKKASDNEMKIPINPASMISVQGKIQAVMTTVQSPVSGQMNTPVAFIKIKIFDKNSNKEHFVQLAPGNFLRLQGLFLKKNDQIKIKGFTAQGSSELKSLILEKDGRIINLRDKFGDGLWNKSELLKERAGFNKNTNR
ncbi:MAG: hypothetical protein ABFR75_04170 [Acidobacteriota bacterium]